MRIVIFGANGQIGRAVFSALKKQFPAAEILACVRKAHLHFEGVAGDHHQHSIAFDPLHDDLKMLGKTDVLINCIGAIDESQVKFETAHVLPLLRITDAFEALGCPLLIQVSALGASATAPSAFFRTKAVAEKLALRLPRAVVVRPSIVCTSGTMLVRRLQAFQQLGRFTGKKIIVPERFLQTKLQPVSGRDLATLIARIVAGENCPRSIDVVGPDTITVAKLIGLAGLRAIPVNQRFSDFAWKIIRPFLKKWISSEQYELLKQDNCSDLKATEKILQRMPASTIPFWKEELAISAKKKAEVVFA